MGYAQRTMIRNASLIFIASVLLAGCYHTATNPSSAPSQSAQEETTPPKTVSLTALNNSGVDGTAVLESVNGQAKVTVTLDGASEDTLPHPAHIHIGTCPNPGAVKYPLNDVINGKSETTLGVSLDNLKQEGKLAVNVHKSAQNLKTYLACGNLQ